MRLVTTAQMRELDRRTIEEAGTSGEILMDRAGFGVADAVSRLSSSINFNDALIHIIAGRGNNGGDAFATARQLKEMGFDVAVWLACAANEIKDDALKHFSRMKAAQVSVDELPTKEDWDEARNAPYTTDIIVDGVLGIGSTGPARGPAAGAIEYINAQCRDAFVVSIDIPSGLNADSGVAEGAAVHADITVTMGLPKRGLVESSALDYVGTIEVVDIGIPFDFIAHLPPDDAKELIYLHDLKPMFPRRLRDSHKGNYGHVLLIGGAKSYAGAIAMAARAAVRSGAGLVTVLAPESIVPIVAAACLESMVVGGRETVKGSLSAEVWPEWRNRIDDFDAVLIGPGLTRHDESLALVRRVIRECTVPLVLDADAISVLEGQPEWVEKAHCPVVMTPHPGELSRLFSEDIEKVQKDRWGVALAASKFTRATVILKGAGTVVAQDGKPLAINMTGNPGMATGGTGDVLAGLLTGLLGHGLAPYDAARAAVYLHGRAGDMAAWRKTQAGIVAGDVIEEIPFVFRDVTLR